MRQKQGATVREAASRLRSARCVAAAAPDPVRRDAVVAGLRASGLCLCWQWAGAWVDAWAALAAVPKQAGAPVVGGGDCTHLCPHKRG
eukprot:gene12487-13680_t